MIGMKGIDRDVLQQNTQIAAKNFTIRVFM